jgi:hypothetical protein
VELAAWPARRADLLLGNAVKDRFHASQTACGGFQHVEDLLLLDLPDQLRLVGMAVLAKHPTVIEMGGGA